MRFDHLMKEVLEHHALMVRHANGLNQVLKNFRTAAYRFAKALIEIRTNHFNEFLTIVTSHQLTIDQWMDDKFAVLEQNFHEDRRNILKAIEDGISEEDYVRDGVIAVTPPFPVHREGAPAQPARLRTGELAERNDVDRVRRTRRR